MWEGAVPGSLVTWYAGTESRPRVQRYRPLAFLLPHTCQGVVVAEVLLYVHRNRRLIRDGSPGRPPRLSHSSRVQCCFTSTETVGLLGTGARDGHLDFHTSTFSRVHTETVGLLGTGAQDGHLDFHTAPGFLSSRLCVTRVVLGLNLWLCM